MPAKRRFTNPPLHTGYRVAIAVIAAMVALGVGAAPSQATTVGVYFDNFSNVAASPTPFNGTFTGGGNVGIGFTAMTNLTTGNNNLAAGTEALYSNTTGNGNVATGTAALYDNTTGDDNVASGPART